MGHWGYVSLAWAGGLLALGVLIAMTLVAARKARAELQAREDRE